MTVKKNNCQKLLTPPEALDHGTVGLHFQFPGEHQVWKTHVLAKCTAMNYIELPQELQGKQKIQLFSDAWPQNMTSYELENSGLSAPNAPDKFKEATYHINSHNPL